MRKSFILGIILLACLLLAGCSTGETESTTEGLKESNTQIIKTNSVSFEEFKQGSSKVAIKKGDDYYPLPQLDNNTLNYVYFLEPDETIPVLESGDELVSTLVQTEYFVKKTNKMINSIPVYAYSNNDGEITSLKATGVGNFIEESGIKYTGIGINDIISINSENPLDFIKDHEIDYGILNLDGIKDFKIEYINSKGETVTSDIPVNYKAAVFEYTQDSISLTASAGEPGSYVIDTSGLDSGIYVIGSRDAMGEAFQIK